MKIEYVTEFPVGHKNHLQQSLKKIADAFTFVESLIFSSLN
jgi:hypothetical protein